MKKEQVSGLDFFKGKYCETIEKKTKNLLNSKKRLRNPEHSPRTMGDMVQKVLEKSMSKCFPRADIKNFKGDYKRKAMSDVSFKDMKNNFFSVDVKTRNEDTDFNMPNMTSVRRIWKFYEKDTNYFVILLVDYKTVDNERYFTNVRLFPIEWFNWNDLRIGALGWGQIQIKNATKFEIDESQNRKAWLLTLHKTVLEFYDEQLNEIKNTRKKFFENGLEKINNKSE